MIQELALLEKGVPCWEPFGGDFTLRAGLCGISADMVGQSKLFCWSGERPRARESRPGADGRALT